MYLYVADDGHAVKVGISANPDKRISQLQTGNPNLIRLACTWRLSSAQARRVESIAHARLANRATEANNEWFDVDVATASMVVQGALRAAGPSVTHHFWQAVNIVRTTAIAGVLMVGTVGLAALVRSF